MNSQGNTITQNRHRMTLNVSMELEFLAQKIAADGCWYCYCCCCHVCTHRIVHIFIYINYKTIITIWRLCRCFHDVFIFCSPIQLKCHFSYSIAFDILLNFDFDRCINTINNKWKSRVEYLFYWMNSKDHRTCSMGTALGVSTVYWIVLVLSRNDEKKKQSKNFIRNKMNDHHSISSCMKLEVLRLVAATFSSADVLLQLHFSFFSL